MNRIQTAFDAGQVTRYHANPRVSKLNQTNADHTAGMLSLLWHLNAEPTLELIKAITYHDNPELFGGDLNYPFKKANPEFARLHDVKSIEMAMEQGQFTVVLGPRDSKWLELLDRLEGYLYVGLHMPDMLKQNEWVDMRYYIIGLAVQLGCYGKELKELLPNNRTYADVKPIDSRTTKEDDELKEDLLKLILNDAHLRKVIKEGIAKAENETAQETEDLYALAKIEDLSVDDFMIAAERSHQKAIGGLKNRFPKGSLRRQMAAVKTPVRAFKPEDLSC